MATVKDASSIRDTGAKGLAFAREVIRIESEMLARVREQLDGSIVRAADLIFRGQGAVIVTGMGKAGLVGQKIAATLASTGTPAFTLHPAEAVHGDLGRVRSGDIVIAVSQSGETAEVLRLIPAIRRLGGTLVAMTSRTDSSLGRAVDLCIALGPIEEACPLGLAPSASTTALMAVGDALALLVSHLRDFRAEDFAANHPGGNLGRRLGRVEDIMRTGRRVRFARDNLTVREVFVSFAGPRRRSGAVMVVNSEGRLIGIFTDSDLARLLEGRLDSSFDKPIGEVMTPNPIKIRVGATTLEAVEVMRTRKISELPVIDLDGRPAGLIDLTDLVPSEPEE